MNTKPPGVLYLLVPVFLLTILLAGCGPTRRIGPEGPQGRRLSWNEMSLDQRKAHMKTVVLPQAAELFGSWRPERFATVDCRLCHGENARAGRFQMPTAHLPRLSGELLLGPEFEKYPETTRLKLDRLVPMMRAALGKKKFNLITRRGFGCYSCHLGPSGPMFGN
jgi:hypothetical protein